MRSLKKTLVLKVDPKNPDNEKVLFSAKMLKAGSLVAFPTETVYGLGANLLKTEAVDRLYKVKKRPRHKPFTVHISNLNIIKKLNCSITKEARAMIERFWPGPLTIILRSKNGKNLGFRMPDNKVALKLIESSGVPVVAPSANISGDPPPRSPKEVLKNLNGKIDVLLDSGRTRVGVESTVIDLTVTPPKVLREGAIKAKELTLYYG